MTIMTLASVVCVCSVYACLRYSVFGGVASCALTMRDMFLFTFSRLPNRLGFFSSRFSKAFAVDRNHSENIGIYFLLATLYENPPTK